MEEKSSKPNELISLPEQLRPPEGESAEAEAKEIQVQCTHKCCSKFKDKEPKSNDSSNRQHHHHHACCGCTTCDNCTHKSCIMKSHTSEDLKPSELGTIDHWDQVFMKELENFKQCGIVGENWFGEDTTSKIVKYICDKSPVGLSDPILDLGCGNGILLLKLAKKGFTNLSGLDFSVVALEYCRNYWAKNEHDEIKTFRLDILEDSDDLPEPILNKKLCIDKGTYDAISLNKEFSPSETRERYFSCVNQILDDEGILILCSCNWTKDELIQHSSKYLSYVEVLPSPKFMFGGQTGSTTTTAVFKKISSKQN